MRKYVDMENTSGKLQAYVMIYDSDGYPRIDNPSAVPDDVWDNIPQEHKDWVNAKCELKFRRTN